jgi:hypothetical protein
MGEIEDLRREDGVNETENIGSHASNLTSGVHQLSFS